MAITYKKCPNCGSKNSLNIVYGYASHELFLEEELGNVRLGGCCIVEGCPEYYCKDCEHEWTRAEAIDEAYKKIKAIKVFIDGDFGGYYNVDVDLVNHRIIWSDSCQEQKIHQHIKQATANQLIEQLKMANVLNWKAKYIEAGALVDGTQWSVELLTDRRAIKKRGNNKFPDEWGVFCKSIENITGKQFR